MRQISFKVGCATFKERIHYLDFKLFFEVMSTETIANMHEELLKQGNIALPYKGESLIAVGDQQGINEFLDKFPEMQAELAQQGFWPDNFKNVTRAITITETVAKFRLYYSKNSFCQPAKIKVSHFLEYRDGEDGEGPILDNHARLILQDADDTQKGQRKLHFYRWEDGPIPAINEAYEMTQLISPALPTVKQELAAKKIDKRKGRGRRL